MLLRNKKYRKFRVMVTGVLPRTYQIQSQDSILGIKFWRNFYGFRCEITGTGLIPYNNTCYRFRDELLAMKTVYNLTHGKYDDRPRRYIPCPTTDPSIKDGSEVEEEFTTHQYDLYLKNNKE